MDTLEVQEVHVDLDDGPEAVKPRLQAAFTGRQQAQSSPVSRRVHTLLDRLRYDNQVQYVYQLCLIIIQSYILCPSFIVNQD